MYFFFFSFSSQRWLDISSHDWTTLDPCCGTSETVAIFVTLSLLTFEKSFRVDRASPLSSSHPSRPSRGALSLPSAPWNLFVMMTVFKQCILCWWPRQAEYYPSQKATDSFVPNTDFGRTKPEESLPLPIQNKDLLESLLYFVASKCTATILIFEPYPLCSMMISTWDASRAPRNKTNIPRSPLDFTVTARGSPGFETKFFMTESTN